MRPQPDAESRRWLGQLRSRGRQRECALLDLHELLLRMAYARLRRAHPPLRADELDETAVGIADEAVVAILAHLDDFQGASRFTTWACQFAVYASFVAMRQRHRRLCEQPVDPEIAASLAGARAGVEREHEQAELLRAICATVNSSLSVRQREVLIALAIDGGSGQAVAAGLGISAGALYKSLHDARCKLRAQLASHGLTPVGELLPSPSIAQVASEQGGPA